MKDGIQKAREYVSSLTNGEIGGGDTPVEVLISCHRDLKEQVTKLTYQLALAQDHVGDHITAHHQAVDKLTKCREVIRILIDVIKEHRPNEDECDAHRNCLTLAERTYKEVW